MASSLCDERHREIEGLKREICCIRDKKRCLDDKLESMCRCLESLKCQAGQLAKANDCVKRERDELCQTNQNYKCHIKELERQACRLNNIVECLREKLNKLSCCGPTPCPPYCPR